MRQTQHDGIATAQVIESLRVALGDALVAVILFDSQVRGDIHEASDWDLLVIAERLPEKTLERHFFLKKALPSDHRGAISILARTREEFESYLPSIYLDVALDGKILYDPQKYAAERLTMLRQLIAQTGLYREQTPAGDVWRWEIDPSPPWALDWEEARLVESVYDRRRLHP